MTTNRHRDDVPSRLRALADDVPDASADAPDRVMRRGRRRRQRQRLAGAGAAAVVAVLAVVVGVSVLERPEVVIDPPPTPAPTASPTTTPSDRPDVEGIGSWETIPEAPIASRSGHAAVWTGSEMVVWGGTRTGPFEPGIGQVEIGTAGGPGEEAVTIGEERFADGAAYDPITRTWRSVADSPLDGGPAEAVWTGEVMVVADGRGDEGAERLAAYDPVTDTWQDIGGPPADVVPTLPNGPLVWSGEEALVWGFGDLDGDEAFEMYGVGYDPATDTWRRLAGLEEGEPRVLEPAEVRDRHAAMWDERGSMVLLGGRSLVDGTDPSTPVLGYEPDRDVMVVLDDAVRWPLDAGAIEAVSTGFEIVVRSDQSSRMFVLDQELAADERRWVPLPDVTGPADLATVDDEAVLVGTGPSGTDRRLVDGEWVPLAPMPVTGRCDPSAVDAGEQLLVWGGNVSCGDLAVETDGNAEAELRSGAILTVATAAAFSEDAEGTWDVIPDAPIDGRTAAAAVWTGTEMLVWGGESYGPIDADGRMERAGEYSGAQGERLQLGAIRFADGAAYDPATMTWRLLAPSPLSPGPATAVWAGDEMVVRTANRQGGGDAELAAYDPATDEWRELPPPPQESFVNVFAEDLAWSGQEVITSGATFVDDEMEQVVQALDPETGVWRPLPAPVDDDGELVPARDNHASLWLDGEYVIIGGRDAATGTAPAPGAMALDVAAGTWRELAPMPVAGDSAVRVEREGDRLVVLVQPTGTDAALRYDPATDSWAELPALRTADRPVLRSLDDTVVRVAGESVDANVVLRGDAWERIAPLPVRARCAPAAVSTGDAVILWGGDAGCDDPSGFDFPTDGALLRLATTGSGPVTPEATEERAAAERAAQIAALRATEQATTEELAALDRELATATGTERDALLAEREQLTARLDAVRQELAARGDR